jgi:hypothetical protein
VRIGLDWIGMKKFSLLTRHDENRNLFPSIQMEIILLSLSQIKMFLLSSSNFIYSIIHPDDIIYIIPGSFNPIPFLFPTDRVAAQ